jgi:transposase
MKQSVVYIGIDVAKAHLDVAWAGTIRRLPNERSGHAALVRWIKQSATPVQLICEASGGYEQALLESMAEQDVAVTLVQAVRVRQYARAAGILAKTDRIDAKRARCLWQRDAIAANLATLCRAKAFASVRSTAPASEQDLGRRRKSSGAT